MVAATQLDSFDTPAGEGVEAQTPISSGVVEDVKAMSMSLPLDDESTVRASEQPPLKRLRHLDLEVDRDCSRDKVRWIPGPEGHLIPFVLNSGTMIVHSGSSRMEIHKVGEYKVVQCLSGCSIDLSCPRPCHCLCHLLREFYTNRALVHY